MNKVQLSVGFADMTNFRLLVDSVGIEDTYRYLQDAFKVAGDKIIEHRGKIRKYIGDTILFTFENAKDAVSAAHEIAGYLKEIGDITLRFNIGIATGEVIVVKIGHPAYMVEDILGKTVNKAALLSREAGKGDSGVALCEETKRIVSA
jgi:adenylate cyclase